MPEADLLVSKLREHYNMPDNDSSVGSGPAAGGPTAEAPKTEDAAPAVKTEFTVKLLKFNEKDKIKVIKEVRAITSLGLKEVH